MEGILNASVELMHLGHITEGGIGSFLSAFADINTDLAEDRSAKMVRKVSKLNSKVLPNTCDIEITFITLSYVLTSNFLTVSEQALQERTLLRHPSGSADLRQL
jgi:hypothetical protein